MSGCQVALVFSSILLSEQGFGSFHQGTAASVDCVESLTPSLLKRGKKPPPTSPKKLKKVMIWKELWWLWFHKQRISWMMEMVISRPSSLFKGTLQCILLPLPTCILWKIIVINDWSDYCFPPWELFQTRNSQGRICNKITQPPTSMWLVGYHSKYDLTSIWQSIRHFDSTSGRNFMRI